MTSASMWLFSWFVTGTVNFGLWKWKKQGLGNKESAIGLFTSLLILTCSIHFKLHDRNCITFAFCPTVRNKGWKLGRHRYQHLQIRLLICKQHSGSSRIMVNASPLLQIFFASFDKVCRVIVLQRDQKLVI